MNNYYQGQGQGQGGYNGPKKEPNPNGGYLNPSNYGADRWWGKITITPELLQQIQQTGAVVVEVYEAKTTQYGPSRRAIAKPYTPRQQTAARPQQGGGINQSYQQNGYNQPQGRMFNQGPAQAQPSNMAAQQMNDFDDSIPF